MNVHRIIFLTRDRDDRQLAVEDAVLPMEKALEGVMNSELARRDLLAGRPVSFDQCVAGIRVHGRLVPATAPNRQGMERRRLERRAIHV